MKTEERGGGEAAGTSATGARTTELSKALTDGPQERNNELGV